MEKAVGRESIPQKAIVRGTREGKCTGGYFPKLNQGEQERQDQWSLERLFGTSRFAQTPVDVRRIFYATTFEDAEVNCSLDYAVLPGSTAA